MLPCCLAFCISTKFCDFRDQLWYQALPKSWHYQKCGSDLGSDSWVWMSLSERGFADLTDVTLADEDTNSILTDKVNRTIQGNVAMHVTHPGNLVVKF